MKFKAKSVVFQGDKLLLLDSEEKEWYGPLCTEEQLRRGYSSYAFIGTDGRIMRHEESIGRVENLIYVGDIEIEFSPEDAVEALINMLSGKGWLR